MSSPGEGDNPAANASAAGASNASATDLAADASNAPAAHLDAPAQPPSPNTLALMKAIDFSPLSLHDASSCASPPSLNATVTRIAAHNQPLSPPVVPAQAALALQWLSRRTSDPCLAAADVDFFLAVRSGEVLCKAVKAPVLPPAPLTSPDVPTSRNVFTFLARVRRLGIPPESRFDPDDLLLARDLPRVIRTLAALSAHLPPSFATLAPRVSGARAAWTASDEPDETWDGDLYARALSAAAANAGRLRIVVGGPQGSGKTALATALLGRVTAPATPALSAHLPDSAYPPRQRRHRRRARFVRAHNWPARPWTDGGALPSSEVQILHAKLAGVRLTLAELPATHDRLERYDPAGATVRVGGASFGDIQTALQGAPVDVALLAARADMFDADEFATACGDLHRLFGGSVWGRVVLVLTHADALPPADSADRGYWARAAEAGARGVLRMFCGPAVAAMVPVVAVDGSTGSGVGELADVAAKVVGESGRSGEKVLAVPLKKWWEDYLLGVFLVWAITRL